MAPQCICVRGGKLLTSRRANHNVKSAGHGKEGKAVLDRGAIREICPLLVVVQELSTPSDHASLPISSCAKSWRLLLGIGVLGGFTTFPSFSLDVVTMIERGAAGAALGYALLSVLGSVLALFAGLWLTRTLGAAA